MRGEEKEEENLLGFVEDEEMKGKKLVQTVKTEREKEREKEIER
jgi:hypothetical protein